jgi:hypothetical protein
MKSGCAEDLAIVIAALAGLAAVAAVADTTAIPNDMIVTAMSMAAFRAEGGLFICDPLSVEGLVARIRKMCVPTTEGAQAGVASVDGLR